MKISDPISALPAPPARESAAPARPDAGSGQAVLESAISRANERLAGQGQQLAIDRDGETGQVVVKLVDLSTREIVRQMPTEAALAFARHLASRPGAFHATA